MSGTTKLFFKAKGAAQHAGMKPQGPRPVPEKHVNRVDWPGNTRKISRAVCVTSQLLLNVWLLKPKQSCDSYIPHCSWDPRSRSKCCRSKKIVFNFHCGCSRIIPLF